MQVYFAMPTTYYNDPKMEKDVELLEKLGYEAYVPNSPKDESEYKAHGMQHFFSLIANYGFNALFFRSFANKMISKGVAGEIKAAFDVGLPVCEVLDDLNPCIFDISRLENRELTIDQTRHFLKTINNTQNLDGLGRIEL